MESFQTRQCWCNQPPFIWHRSIHNLVESSSLLRMRANALKECFKDFCIFTAVNLPSLYPFPRHAPVPKQGTKHLVTDALVLPCQLLVLPATIWCYPAARATKRDWPVSDPLLTSVTPKFAFSQSIVQVCTKMNICLTFVTIEVEELSLDKAHFGGDLINL